MFNTGGFKPLYNGFIQFPTASYEASASLTVSFLRDVFYHNTEWLYGTSGQTRVNWYSIHPSATGASGSSGGNRLSIPVNETRLLTSDGPFQVQLQDDNTPMPLYVRANVGLIDPSGSTNCTGAIHVHLRQGARVGQIYGGGDVLSKSLEGTGASWIEFDSKDSQLSVTSSVIELYPAAVQSPLNLSTRATRSTTVDSAVVKVKIIECYLDIWGTPTGSSPCAGFEVYGVYAHEFVPSRSF